MRLLPLHVCNRSNDYEEAVINFVKYRDKMDAVKNTLNVYDNVARRKKSRMKLAETVTNKWKTKRDNLTNGKKKTHVPYKVTRKKEDDGDDESYCN